MIWYITIHDFLKDTTSISVLMLNSGYISKTIMKQYNLLSKIDNYWAPPIYDYLPTWLFPKHSLKFKVYGVGLPKTGTASLYFLFRNYRTYHEPENRFLIYKLLAFEQGKISRKQLIHYLRKRDKRLQLEMDSGCNRLSRFLR